jgi:segregation and condensation protein A
VVVSFVALLELCREALVDITQAEAYAPIYVRLAYTPSAPQTQAEAATA